MKTKKSNKNTVKRRNYVVKSALLRTGAGKHKSVKRYKGYKALDKR